MQEEHPKCQGFSPKNITSTLFGEKPNPADALFPLLLHLMVLLTLFFLLMLEVVVRVLLVVKLGPLLGMERIMRLHEGMGLVSAVAFMQSTPSLL